MPFVTGDAPTRDELTSCVQCGLCLPYCPTYRLTLRESASPRGRIAAMAAVFDGSVPVDEEFDEAMSFCLGCRACEAVCPSLVQYGRLIEGARSELTVQRSTPARRVRRVVLGRILPSAAAVRLATLGVRIIQRGRWAGVLPRFARRGVAGLRPLSGRVSWLGRVAEPVGEPRGTVALLSGCVMDAWFGPVHDATVSLLQRAGYRVVVPRSQTCCGALAAHDGHAGEARLLAGRNIAAFAGVDLIVSDSAGCTAHLKEYGHWHEGAAAYQSKVKDATELIASLIADRVLPTLSRPRGSVAVQDPCHLRHAQRISAQPRAILRAAGYTPVEIDPDGLCCGAAGIYSVLRPGTSAQLGERKADQVRGSGCETVASANPGCEMQLRSSLGPGYRVAHPVELYWEALAGAGQPAGLDTARNATSDTP